jgi:hypothetical protein
MFLSILCAGTSLLPVQSAPAKETTKAAVSKAAESKAAESKAASKQKLRRADFRVTGASCVTCLRRIGRTMRAQPGVLKGDVSIFKPYWAVVVYDSNQTDMDKIYASLSHEKVKFDDVEVKEISSLPLIVIPKGMSSESSSTAGSTVNASGAAH